MSKYEPGGFPPPEPHVAKLQERVRELEAELRNQAATAKRAGVLAPTSRGSLPNSLDDSPASGTRSCMKHGNTIISFNEGENCPECAAPSGGSEHG